MRRIILIIFFSVSTISFSQEKIQTEKGLKSDFIYKSGNIGIGITNPKSFLHINGWSGSRGISLDLNTSPNGSNSPNIIWDARNGGASYFFTARQEHNRLDFSRYKDFWSGHIDILSLQGSNGFVGIGTSNPDSKLTVAGKIHSREVLVTLNAGDGADFVFENDYNLPSLKK